MTSKIIPFRPHKTPSAAPDATYRSPKARTEALPEWLHEFDVEWIFQEEERRKPGAKA